MADDRPLSLDDQIEQNDADDAGGNGRTCYVCRSTYGLAGPEYEDVGVCLDCAQEGIRDALRYRWIRANASEFFDHVSGPAKDGQLFRYEAELDAAVDARLGSLSSEGDQKP
jgi:hypothetical protein